ncbi:hypothetical protein BDR05DRAFT_947722 [Suillus weaverae]|nr:hypothetical protein BDR05DRAFT_947722 [Suillus weaverae]
MQECKLLSEEGKSCAMKIKSKVKYLSGFPRVQYWIGSTIGQRDRTCGVSAPDLERVHKHVQDSDVFDAITMQNHLDSGSEGGSLMSPEKIAIDLYITPQELQEVPQQIGGDVTVLVQAFSQEFTIPHLQCFAKHCAIEKIKPPKYYGPQHLPPPLVPTGACILCSVQVPQTFVKGLQASLPATVDSKNPASAAICQGVEWANSRLTTPLLIWVIHSLVLDPILTLPSTDSNWETTSYPSCMCLLELSKKWDLTYQQASVLSKALLADFQGMPLNPEIVKCKFSMLSTLLVILKCLGILVFLCAVYLFGLFFL